MLDPLLFSAFLLSLNETKNTKRLNKINIVWKNKNLKLVKMAKYWNNDIKIKETQKTRYLNTAIIDKEWIISLKKDICEGPKYRIPLKEFISLYFLICFLKDPEKLLHKLALVDKSSKSLFVKQL